jgi:hypothetical protein
VDGSAAGSTTLTLPAAATAGNGFLFYVFKSGTQNNVIIDGNGAETIDGVTTFTLSAQYSGLFLLCDGTGWGTFRDDRTPINRDNRGFSLTNGTDATHDINFGAGGCWDSTNTFFFTAGALVKQLDAGWAVGTAAGALDTGTFPADDILYLYAIRKDSDGSGDIVASLSATWAGVTKTAITAYTYGRRIGAVPVVSSALLAFIEFNGVVAFSAVNTAATSTSLTNDSMTAVTLAAVPRNARATGVIRGVFSAFQTLHVLGVGPAAAAGNAIDGYGCAGGNIDAGQSQSYGAWTALADSSQQISYGKYQTTGTHNIQLRVSEYDLIDRFAE